MTSIFNEQLLEDSEGRWLEDGANENDLGYSEKPRSITHTNQAERRDLHEITPNSLYHYAKINDLLPKKSLVIRGDGRESLPRGADVDNDVLAAIRTGVCNNVLRGWSEEKSITALTKYYQEDCGIDCGAASEHAQADVSAIKAAHASMLASQKEAILSK